MESDFNRELPGTGAMLFAREMPLIVDVETPRVRS